MLKIQPLRRRRAWRYLRLQHAHAQSPVARIDAIGHACRMRCPRITASCSLAATTCRPGEQQGLQQRSGPHRRAGSSLQHDASRPNGEDVLYVFHNDRRTGATYLLPYNLIRKEVANPDRVPRLHACLDDGQDGGLQVGRPTSRCAVHPMQVWQTPFMSRRRTPRPNSPPMGPILGRRSVTPIWSAGISDALTRCGRR